MLEFKLGFVRLGRDPGCELRVEGDGSTVVSSLHAQFGDRGGRWFIEDLFSRNGTLVDGQTVTPGRGVVVTEGQVVQLGRTGPQFRVMRTTQRMTTATLVEAQLDGGAVAVLQQWHGSGPQTAMSPEAAQAALAGLPQAHLADAPPPEAPPHSDAAPEPSVPAPTDAPWLTLNLDDRDSTFALTTRSARIGRSAMCDVVIPEATQSPVSRVHAELAVRPDGSVLVVDSGSTHGTYVNGERVELARALEPGDVITLGRSGPALTVRTVRGRERGREGGA
jgi:pSer/pThr/pTyr-binding forkhead associated (FHA) protein